MNLFKKYELSEIAGINGLLSNDMKFSIQLWEEMLTGRAQWNREGAQPCGIIQNTIGELAKPVSEELKITTDNEALIKPMQLLQHKAPELVQNLVALGGSVVRPIYSNNKLQFEIIRLGNYIPTSYDLDGTLTGCIITKKIVDGKSSYILVERHEYKSNIITGNYPTGTAAHCVELELYLIKGESLRRVNLTDCEKTKDLTASYMYENMQEPLIVEIRNRAPNVIDGSEVPCALWQNTENLIEDADRQYNRINWEQEGGELRVFADSSLFEARQGEDKRELSPKLKKLFVAMNNPASDAEQIKEHAPALRTDPQVKAFNEILKRCELAWNIGKGTISDTTLQIQTATQYTGGKETYYSMVDNIESELEEKYTKLASVFAYLASAYEGVQYNEEIKITYNDTGRKNPEKMRLTAQAEVGLGIMSKAEYREQFYGETPEEAAAKVPAEPTADSFGGFNFGA